MKQPFDQQKCCCMLHVSCFMLPFLMPCGVTRTACGWIAVCTHVSAKKLRSVYVSRYVNVFFFRPIYFLAPHVLRIRSSPAFIVYSSIRGRIAGTPLPPPHHGASLPFHRQKSPTRSSLLVDSLRLTCGYKHCY